MIIGQLRRVRWAVRATLVLGVAASVVANILHALDNPVSQAIAAWPPLALLLTVELISRVPVHRRSLAAARLVATATIAGIAAWVSYWHMAGVAARYGETGASPYLLPLSVDGLIVVASICLVELGGRISALERDAQPATQPAAAPPTSQSAAAQPTAQSATTPPTAQPAVAPPAPRPAAAQPVASTNAPSPTKSATRAKAPAKSANPAKAAATTPPKPAQRPMPGLVPVPAPRSATAAKPRTRRSPVETVAEAAKIKAKRPHLTDTQLAAELGISVSRWRAIRRETGAGDDLHLAA